MSTTDTKSSISAAEEKEILEKFSWATSKLVTRMIPFIQRTYGDEINLIDLIMALPITFKLKEIKHEELPEKIDPRQTVIGGYITRDTDRGNPDRMIVHLIMTKDVNESWDDFFKKLLGKDSSYYIAMMAFVYMHEALHVLMRHYDYYLNETYANIVRRIKPELDENQISELLNHAFDYWINGYLIEKASSGSVISSFKSENGGFMGLYDPNLVPGVLEQPEIVQKLAKEAEFKSIELVDSEGNQWGTMVEVTINGRTSRTIYVPNQHASPQQDEAQEQEQDLQEVLDGTRREMLEKTRGEGSSGTLTKLGVDYSVPVDWFKHLRASLFNVVQKYTSHYEVTWGRLKNKFRHIAPMPGRIYYEKELAAVISIDQSGSMSDQDLEKINYVVSQLAKKCVFTEVLLHDYTVAERKRFIGKKFKGIREFITNRVACGGTSHKHVFETLDEIKRENPKRKVIYLSFSDNWSDIEEVYDERIFKGITAYWITTDERKLVDVPGMQISLENGLLRM